ncbi:MAG: isoprenylcysteine carboxylmethyltransferase family protein [Candidatus Sulfotelmatobacter sp.]|jgi:protein-S-isoprenylcysteine O-methyltransferase Ste14
MHWLPLLFPVMWLAYIAYWRAMAADLKSDERRESASSRLQRFAVMILALVLLGVPSLRLSVLDGRFLPASTWWFWIGAVVTASGLLFSVCGRRYLGRNWSRAVTIKKDHELITGGPYSLVRHPIYTGLLAGLFGCALAVGEWRGLVAVGLVFIALLRKLRLEEQWMREQFGEVYENYSRQVRALVPYVF